MSRPEPGRDPWADPATPTEPGAPYAGPPPTAPPGAASPGYGAAPPGYGAAPPGYGWAPPGYGWAPPGYGWPPGGAPGGDPWGGYPDPWSVGQRGPRRPGQVIASAVLAFVQAALVLVASLYVWFFASIIALAAAGAPGSFDARGLETEGTVLAVVQLFSAVLLVTAGVLALNRRTRSTWLLLLVAHAVQVVLSAYWLVRLFALLDVVPGADADVTLLGVTLVFAAAPLVGSGLLVSGVARRWFAREEPAA